MTKTRWEDIPSKTRDQWAENTRLSILREKELAELRREQRKWYGAGRRSTHVRCPIRTRNRLLALSTMRDGLAVLHGVERDRIGWRLSGSEELRRIVDQEFNSTVEALEYLASTDARAASILARGMEIAEHGLR